jgi:hypothetical protein
MGACSSAPDHDIEVTTRESEDLRLSKAAQEAAQDAMRKVKENAIAERRAAELLKARKEAEELEREAEREADRHALEAAIQAEKEEAALSEKKNDEDRAQLITSTDATEKKGMEATEVDSVADENEEALPPPPPKPTKTEAVTSTNVSATTENVVAEDNPFEDSICEPQVPDEAKEAVKAADTEAEKEDNPFEDSICESQVPDEAKEAVKAADTEAEKEDNPFEDSENEADTFPTESQATIDSREIAVNDANKAVMEAKKYVDVQLPPTGQCWKMKKCARNGGFFSQIQNRWLVLSAGDMHYYDLNDGAPDSPPFYVKPNSIPKNNMKHGIIGCSAQRWHDQFESTPDKTIKKKRASKIGGNDNLTVQVISPREDPLIMQFDSEVNLTSFLDIFAKHVEYYTKKDSAADFQSKTAAAHVELHAT